MAASCSKAAPSWYALGDMGGVDVGGSGVVQDAGGRRPCKGCDARVAASLAHLFHGAPTACPSQS